MSDRPKIPAWSLKKPALNFLEYWRMDRHGIPLTGDETNRNIYIWGGRFVLHETITIVADEMASQYMEASSLYVGIVSEKDCVEAQASGESILRVYADAATHHVTGIQEAIDLLEIFTEVHSPRS